VREIKCGSYAITMATLLHSYSYTLLSLLFNINPIYTT